MTQRLYVTNARVWTGATPAWVRSLTIHEGRVAALDTPCRNGDRVLDAGGCVVTPGLVDAHVHLLLAGEMLDRLDLSGVTSRAEFERAIADRHATLPPGTWLLAQGWSQENWGGVDPDKTWLAAAGDRPVVCHRTDLHASVVNDAVLAQCDLDAARPVSWGGRIGHDESGTPTGLMVEAAAWEIINPLIPKTDVETRQRALLAAQTHAHRYGLTAVGTMEYAGDVACVFEPLRDELTLRCRVVVLDRAWPMDFDFGVCFPDDDRLAVTGYKAFLDGSFGSRSARMLADYADDPGNRGLLVELAAQGDLAAWARGVSDAGLSPVMHAIGDEAIRLALDVIETLPAERPLHVRPRIEHLQQLDVADVPRFAGVIASMQPLHKADDGRYAERRVGPARLGGTFAFRRLLDAGATLAFGSDWPVVSCDPLAGIRAAVTGLTRDGEVFRPDQNLTVEETLRAYTTGAAHAIGLDDAGTLAPGGLGDLVIFDRDPFTADWADAPPRITTTIVGGQPVFET